SLFLQCRRKTMFIHVLLVVFFFFFSKSIPSISTLFPYTTLFRSLPIPLNDDSYNFSFSGLKSAVINLNHNEEQKGKEINKADLADRKSTRLNSSHVSISYAVFCLKKKKKM